jgi:hypothetical protein
MTTASSRSQAWWLAALLARIGLDVPAQGQPKTGSPSQAPAGSGTAVLLEVRGEVSRPLAWP